MNEITTNNIYTVRSYDWKLTIVLDQVYEDNYYQACQEALRIILKTNESKTKFEIGPVLLCKHLNDKYDTVYNSCKILQNLNYENEAQSIRDKFIKESHIDLYEESLCSTANINNI